MDHPHPRGAARDRAHHPPPPVLALANTPPRRVSIALPGGSTIALPLSWADPDLWRSGEPALAVREITRQRTRDLLGEWDHPKAASRSFGAQSIALFQRGEPRALLTAANASAPVIDRSLGLLRSNCIELSLLATAPNVTAGSADSLLERIWREHLAQRNWPYYPQVRKIALICYPTSAGASLTLSASAGWEPVRLADKGQPLSVCWLSPPPGESLAAFTEAPSPPPRAMVALAA
jgi:hypothetical protein